MAIISLGKIDRTLIYPLIPIIIMIFELNFWDHFEEVSKHKTEFNIIQSLSKCVAIIPLVISNIKNKNAKDNPENENRLFFKKNKRNNYKKFGFIVLINILNLIFKITYYRIINYFMEVNIISWYIIDIILITLFARLILKSRIYRHQYLSIIVIVIAGLTLNAIHGEFDGMKLKDAFINIFGDSVYSLMIVFKRYAMVNLFCSAYEITFSEGVFSLVFFSILLIILSNIEIPADEKYEKGRYVELDGKFYIDNFYSYIELLKNDKRQIFVSVIFFIYYIPYYIFFNLTIKNNSVFHVLVILLSEESLFYAYEKDAFIICMNILLTIILLFMFLVFIEIIELNFLGFSTNLKRHIAERAKIDGVNENDIGSKSSNRSSLVEMGGVTINLLDEK